MEQIQDCYISIRIKGQRVAQMLIQKGQKRENMTQFFHVKI